MVDTPRRYADIHSKFAYVRNTQDADASCALTSRPNVTLSYGGAKVTTQLTCPVAFVAYKATCTQLPTACPSDVAPNPDEESARDTMNRLLSTYQCAATAPEALGAYRPLNVSSTQVPSARRPSLALSIILALQAHPSLSIRNRLQPPRNRLRR